jgi:hypothetical protein
VTIQAINDPLDGERVIGLSPQNADEAAIDWLRRPNIFPGRALTQGALQQSQAWAAGHIAKRGQDWVAGVVAGLEVQAQAVEGSGFAATRLQVAQGRGLAVSGEDVVLNTALQCALADVPVVAPPGFFIDGSGVEAGTEGETPTLLPRVVGTRNDGLGIARVVTLGDLGAAQLATLPPLGVLVLQPVQVDGSQLDPTDPCEHSACDENSIDDTAAFADWRITDAVRLLWFVWPGEWRGIPAVPDAQLRNALAWTVFQAEADLPAGGSLPWEDWGVPVALVALDAGRRPRWFDRASVVRAGGRARDSRLHLVDGAMTSESRLPSLWQARFEQLAEQVAAAGSPLPAPKQLSTGFGRFLPPVGLLPASCFDPATHQSGFFPSAWQLDASPVPVDQLDLAIRASAGLAPLAIGSAERVRLLVPVPLSSWEPRLLQTEVIDPLFQSTLDDDLLTRARTLGLRQGLRFRAAMLSHALDGQTPVVASFRDDPLALETESLSPWGEPPPGGGHRSALMPGLHQHLFDATASPFLVNAGEQLFVWVCLDPDNPPQTLMLQWSLAGDWGHRAFWGADLIPGGAAGTAAHVNMGPLPTAGEWVMLTIDAAKLGLAGKSPTGMTFSLFDGCAAYGLVGARTPTGSSWRKWFCNVLPRGAIVQGNEAWDLLTANDLWSPFEPHGGVMTSLVAPTAQGQASTPVVATGPQSAFGPQPTGGTNIYHPLAQSWRGHTLGSVNGVPIAFLNAQATLMRFVYLDELAPPRALACIVVSRSPNTPLVMLQLAVWGEDHTAALRQLAPGLTAGQGNNVVVASAAQPLPRPGAWQLLALPSVPGPSPSQPAPNVLQIHFVAFGGAVAFSDLGVATVQTDNTYKPTPIWPLPPPGAAAPNMAILFGGVTIVQKNLGVLTPTPSSQIGTVGVFTQLASDPLIQALSTQEQAQLPLRGLSGFCDYLSARVDRADDISDFGFAHMQVDMYRLRQLTMSTSDATRLAISPTLAAIATSGSALDVTDQIKNYIASVKAAPSAQLPKPTVGVNAVAPKPVLSTTLAGGAFASATVSRQAAAAVVSKSALSTGIQMIRGPSAPPNVVLSNPVISVPQLYTTSIAQRLNSPPSTEARDYSLANRQTTIRMLLGLVNEFVAEDGGVMPGMFVDFAIPGLAKDPFLHDRSQRTLSEFVQNPALIDELLQSPPIPPDKVDEGVLFTQTVSLSDITIGILRQLEARVVPYRNALARCQTALAQLQSENDDIADRLVQVADDLAEVRHDVSVARALMAEEQQRIAAVNARRAQVLATEVKFIAYQRPREIDVLVTAPTHAVDPGDVAPAVPACLQSHPDTPAELQDMLRVVREAPSTWFPVTTGILQGLDKIDQLIKLVQSAQLRAFSGIAVPQIATPAANAGTLPLSIARVASRQVEALAPRLAAIQAIAVPTLVASTWQGIFTQAAPAVSLADLADGAHGRGDIAARAARELADIAGVVTCLHAGFSGVPAVLRLQWAETLSEFDAAPNLRNLASLSRWSEIEVEDRRRMQQLVDWLFAQVDTTQAAAGALMNDVVRMCLLLASHAPIDRIIAGRMARPVTGVVVGVRIPLTVLDSTSLRVGMQALMYRDTAVVARALVDDVGPSGVSARVIQTAAAHVDLGDDVRVHFDDSAAVSLAPQAAARTLFRIRR